MEIFGIVLFAIGVCITLIRVPLPLNVDLSEIRSAWMAGPVLMVVGGVLWWAF